MESINIIINNCITYLQSIGLIGGFLIVLLESIFPFLPLAVFIGMNILAYGNIVGFLLSYFATIVGCCLSFALFRYVIKSFILKLLNNKTITKIEKYMQKMSNIDFNALVILIAIPFTPAFLVNIAAGLSKIPFKKFFAAVLIGKISIIYFWGYVGSSLLDGLTDPIVLIKIFCLVLGAYIISKIVEKIIKVEE